MKQLLTGLLLLFVSCREIPKQEPLTANQKAAQEVEQIVAPLAARQIGLMDYNIQMARDKQQDHAHRQYYLDDVRRNSVGYLFEVRMEFLDSAAFKDLRQAEVDLITAKIRVEVSKELYLKSLENKAVLQNKLNDVK